MPRHLSCVLCNANFLPKRLLNFLRNFGSTWYKAKIAFVLKSVHLSRDFSHFRNLSIRSACVNVFLFSSDNQLTRQPKQVPDDYTIFRLPYWRTRDVLQHGGSILGSVILRGTFRRISQLWDNTHMELSSSSIMSQFLDFTTAWFLIFFLLRDNEHTL